MIYQKQFPQQDSPSSWCSNNFEYLTPQSSPVNELNSAEDTIDIISTDRLQEPFLYSQDQVHDLPAEIAANLKMDTDSFMDSGYSNNTLITDGEQNIFQIYQNEDAETSIPCVSSFQNIYGPYEVKVIETNAADELNTPQIAQRNPFIFSLNPVQSQELNKDNTDLPEYYKQNTPLSCYEDSCTEDTLESENKFEEIFMENSSENTVSVDMKENNNNYLQQQNINLNKQITYKSKTIIAPVIMGKPLGPALRRSLRQKAPALKLRIEKCNEPVENVHTPEITDAILDMEAKIGNFDLISYLTDDVKTAPLFTIKAEEMIDTIERKPYVEAWIEQASSCSSPPPAKRQRRTSMQSTTSASASCSDYSNSPAPARRRGRPAKPIGVLPDPSQYSHLNPEESKYAAMRDKNNEASRRSRYNRKSMESALEKERAKLEAHHAILSAEDQKLERQCEKWKNAVMKLALL